MHELRAIGVAFCVFGVSTGIKDALSESARGMKFLVDAQLPRRLSRQLRVSGHDVVHTLDLPSGNRTTDAEIMRIADSEERIVVTYAGRILPYDHKHRHSSDKGVPYAFQDAHQLLTDFLADVDSVLQEVRKQ